jgi:membrane fusion protein, multidrug efflux system
VREANLGPQMTARISQIFVEEGDKVKAGSPLVQLDSVEASLRVQQTAANSASLQSQYELAKAEYERLAPLAEKGTVTAQQLQRLAGQRDALKAGSDAARVAEEDAKRNAGNTSVRAPFAGIVSKVMADVGEVATMMPVTVLLRLVDLSSVDVRVRVHERELSRISIGDAVEAKFSSSGQTAQGKVTFISPEIDPRTRNAEVVTRIPNADAALRAGMFAEISIRPKGVQQSLIIPTTAVSGAGDNRFVYAINNGVAERRKVRIAPIDRDTVEVLEGLKEGDPIVREGLGRLSDGAKIALAEPARVQPAPSAETAKAVAPSPGATP